MGNRRAVLMKHKSFRSACITLGEIQDRTYLQTPFLVMFFTDRRGGTAEKGGGGTKSEGARSKERTYSMPDAT